MSVDKADIMREFVQCFETKDIEKALSFCTDDIVWETPLGTFKGKEEVIRYLKWNEKTIKDGKFTESGIGILVQGDKAFFEHKFTGIIQGENVSFLAICTYEFSGEKINKLRTVFDRLSIAEQATNKWLPKKLVSSIVSQLQKGLD